MSAPADDQREREHDIAEREGMIADSPTRHYSPEVLGVLATRVVDGPSWARLQAWLRDRRANRGR